MGLSTKQAAGIQALMAHGTLEAAARALKVNVATLRRWRRQPEFCQALESAKREALDQFQTRLQAAAAHGLQTLEEVMTTALLHPGARVAAARVVLEHVQRVLERERLEDRIRVVEEKLRVLTMALPPSAD
jgi:hypothetical protein